MLILVHPLLSYKKEKTSEFQLKDRLIYKEAQLCIPKDERLQWIHEPYTSKVVIHFGVEKILLNLRCYVFWSKIQLDVSQYIVVVFYAILQSLLIGNLDYILHCQYLANLRRAFQWNFLGNYLKPSLEMIACL